MTFRSLFLAGLALALMIAPALADPPPMPEKKTVSLEALSRRLEEESSRSAALEKQAKALKKDLDSTRGELVDLARDMRKNETALRGLEQRLAAASEERSELGQRLEKDYGSLAGLILALQRMRRVPPEAMLARPESPYRSAQSALVLQSVLSPLYRRAEGVKSDIERLSVLTRQIEEDREAVEARSKELDLKNTEMTSLLEKRRSLYTQTDRDRRAKADEIRRISAQASTLKDLVRRLEDNRRLEEEKARRETRAASAAGAGARKPKAAHLPSPGRGQIPASGIIRTAFGQPDDFGAPSEGIKIEGRPGGMVVSPLGGRVKFSGPFRRFGNIVIIEHEGGYHSLLAGLARVDAVEGQNVSAGEPVGVLGRGTFDDHALKEGAQTPGSSLYYELRHNGKPVDPAGVFAGLG